MFRLVPLEGAVEELGEGVLAEADLALVEEEVVDDGVLGVEGVFGGV